MNRVPKTKPTVRFSTDADLSASSFIHATSLVGAVEHPDRYVLTVHPTEIGDAERTLRSLFTEPYRWDERVILKTEPFNDIFTWTLEGRDAILFCPGA